MAIPLPEHEILHLPIDLCPIHSPQNSPRKKASWSAVESPVEQSNLLPNISQLGQNSMEKRLKQHGRFRDRCIILNYPILTSLEFNRLRCTTI